MMQCSFGGRVIVTSLGVHMLPVSKSIKNTCGRSWMRENNKICCSGRVQPGKPPTLSKNGYTECFAGSLQHVRQ